MNLSSSILREIVGKKFSVKTSKVTISGKIEPMYGWIDGKSSHYGRPISDYSYEVFSFCIEKGLHQLDVVSTRHNDGFNPFFEKKAKYTLAEAIRNECPESIFIVVVLTEKGERKATVYKSPTLGQCIDAIKKHQDRLSIIKAKNA